MAFQSAQISSLKILDAPQRTTTFASNRTFQSVCLSLAARRSRQLGVLRNVPHNEVSTVLTITLRIGDYNERNNDYNTKCVAMSQTWSSSVIWDVSDCVV